MDVRSIKISAAQFEPCSGNKNKNLETMEALIEEARSKRVQVISFHELSTTGYTFLKDLSQREMWEMAEEIPDGKTTQNLIYLARKHEIIILAGILEKSNGSLYNSYIAVNSEGVLACHRKLHPFISSYLSPGNSYTIFELFGWKCGILICYDNNIIENVRTTTLAGAEIIFAPHVTGCTPSSMPGRGYVSDELWKNKTEDPVSLRLEFEGPKHRGWLMRWLPARAFDNGVYYVFSNPIGYDGEHLKGGNAMILDPYGEVLVETRSFASEIASAVLTRDKLTLSGGFRYRNARRPELYRDILGEENDSITVPFWMDESKES